MINHQTLALSDHFNGPRSEVCVYSCWTKSARISIAPTERYPDQASAMGPHGDPETHRFSRGRGGGSGDEVLGEDRLLGSTWAKFIPGCAPSGFLGHLWAPGMNSEVLKTLIFFEFKYVVPQSGWKLDDFSKGSLAPGVHRLLAGRKHHIRRNGLSGAGRCAAL